MAGQTEVPVLDLFKCRILRHVGTGGFADVFAAGLKNDRGREELVALKILKPAQKGQPQACDAAERLFLSEAESCGMLSHKNLIRSLGLFRIPASVHGAVYLRKPTWGLLLEYCESGTLRNRIVQSMDLERRSYSDADALGWLADVAEALRFLHTQKPDVIIHRDIKAENVLLKKEGGRVVAKLGDLGLHVRVEERRSVMLRRRGADPRDVDVAGPTFVTITPAASEAMYLSRALSRRASEALPPAAGIGGREAPDEMAGEGGAGGLDDYAENVGSRSDMGLLVIGGCSGSEVESGADAENGAGGGRGELLAGVEAGAVQEGQSGAALVSRDSDLAAAGGDTATITTATATATATTITAKNITGIAAAAAVPPPPSSADAAATFCDEEDERGPTKRPALPLLASEARLNPQQQDLPFACATHAANAGPDPALKTNELARLSEELAVPAPVVPLYVRQDLGGSRGAARRGLSPATPSDIKSKCSGAGGGKKGDRSPTPLRSVPLRCLHVASELGTGQRELAALTADGVAAGDHMSYDPLMTVSTITATGSPAVLPVTGVDGGRETKIAHLAGSLLGAASVGVLDGAWDSSSRAGRRGVGNGKVLASGSALSPKSSLPPAEEPADRQKEGHQPKSLISHGGEDSELHGGVSVCQKTSVATPGSQESVRGSMQRDLRDVRDRFSVRADVTARDLLPRPLCDGYLDTMDRQPPTTILAATATAKSNPGKGTAWAYSSGAATSLVLASQSEAAFPASPRPRPITPEVQTKASPASAAADQEQLARESALCALRDALALPGAEARGAIPALAAGLPHPPSGRPSAPPAMLTPASMVLDAPLANGKWGASCAPAVPPEGHPVPATSSRPCANGSEAAIEGSPTALLSPAPTLALSPVPAPSPARPAGDGQRPAAAAGQTSPFQAAARNVPAFPSAPRSAQQQPQPALPKPHPQPQRQQQQPQSQPGRAFSIGVLSEGRVMGLVSGAFGALEEAPVSGGRCASRIRISGNGAGGTVRAGMAIPAAWPIAPRASAAAVSLRRVLLGSGDFKAPRSLPMAAGPVPHMPARPPVPSWREGSVGRCAGAGTGNSDLVFSFFATRSANDAAGPPALSPTGRPAHLMSGSGVGGTSGVAAAATAVAVANAADAAAATAGDDSTEHDQIGFASGRGRGRDAAGRRLPGTRGGEVSPLQLTGDAVAPLSVDVSMESFRRHMRRVASITALLNSTSGNGGGSTAGDTAGGLPDLESYNWVYGLTGRAGSCMYMAPEVYLKQPYNEKCDVFSFGVLMYELLTHELLLRSFSKHIWARAAGIRTPPEYAQKVSEGFRPPRRSCLSDAQWSLISRCWHQDPCERPGMEQVGRELRALLDQVRLSRSHLSSTFCAPLSGGSTFLSRSSSLTGRARDPPIRAGSFNTTASSSPSASAFVRPSRAAAGHMPSPASAAPTATTVSLLGYKWAFSLPGYGGAPVPGIQAASVGPAGGAKVPKRRPALSPAGGGHGEPPGASTAAPQPSCGCCVVS